MKVLNNTYTVPCVIFLKNYFEKTADDALNNINWDVTDKDIFINKWSIMLDSIKNRKDLFVSKTNILFSSYVPSSK